MVMKEQKNFGMIMNYRNINGSYSIWSKVQ